ncbi:MAG: hypothetical protein ACXWUD_00430 [Methylosarcina sp.]
MQIKADFYRLIAFDNPEKKQGDHRNQEEDEDGYEPQFIYPF